ncbi:stage III sporulation protein AD [Clostridium cellulovorans]|uniref:Stage III sporulation protein AD n=1 Tax=Clostridium cellulovorans (strain ATCC 35296 / DSM 3052 / OCM 3 / 743B) TaxID=573061 RepID=D9SLF4_CLOC7|nr:stage III sporulation protein AD [Clostridium cellulovorans]ADL51670.1 stage III sporulation protein AD [Clostridium cellulovorans 743B]
MEITKIVAIALISTFIIIFLKAVKREDLATTISIIVGVSIFFVVIAKLSSLINFLHTIALKANIDYTYLTTVLKIMGIAYLTSFCSDICKEAGAGNIASKVELSGKVFILILTIPIFMGVLDSILEILRS